MNLPRLLSFLSIRLLQGGVTLFFILSVSFFVIRFSPGGPFDRERTLPPEIEKNIERAYRLDKPLLPLYFEDGGIRVLTGWREIRETQFVATLLMYARGELGPSFRYSDRSVNELLREGFPPTLALGTAALLFALIMGVPAGVAGALFKNRWADRLLLIFSGLGIAIPNFVLAPILVLLLSVTLHLLPPAGWGRPSHLVIPAFTLSLFYTAYIMRLVRSGTAGVLESDFVDFARARGIPEVRVLFFHSMKGALTPLVSWLGPATAGLLTGSVVIEEIFQIPGIGRHFVHAALNRDYTLVMGTVILYSTLLVMLNIAVDLIYTLLDPRVELKR